MKLRHRIIISALLPVAIIMVIAIALSNSQMNTFVMNEAYTGMEATAIAVRQVFDNNGNGPYHVVDGELWKADFINISRCNHIVDNIKNNTGYEVTVFFGDTRMLTTLQDENGNRQVGTQCSPEVYQAVVENGETYTSDNADIFGTRYIVLYIPLYQTASKAPVGMIFLGQPYTNVSTNINKASLQTFVVMLVVALIAVVVILLIANSIVKPIFKSIGYLQEMGGGSIGFKIDDDLLSRKDEIGTMVREVDSLNNSLLGIVVAIKEQVDVLQTTFDDCNRNTQRAMEETEQIDETVSGLSIANTTLAGDAMAAGDSVDTISQIIENTNNQVDTFKETANTMEQAAKSAKSTLNELNSSMNEVMAAVQEVSGKTAETHESVSQIASMVNVISEIASQTNLLSLNASIEAARAGEAGRGFAVVASEIQGLADQSDKSAKEIQTVLNQLVTNSNLSVATMNKMQVMIDTQKDKIAQTNDAFDGVDSGIAQTVLGIDNIVEQMTKLDGARNATSATVQNVASIAQENAASAEETASNMNEIASHITSITEKIKQLGDVASTLSNNVDAFKLDN